MLELKSVSLFQNGDEIGILSPIQISLSNLLENIDLQGK